MLVPVFKNDGKRSIAKNYHPVSPFSVVSKVFEKPVNKRIVDQLEKCGLFSDFQNVLGLLNHNVFDHNTLMTFLMMLSVILLSMLMILLSALIVIKYLICGNN